MHRAKQDRGKQGLVHLPAPGSCIADDNRWANDNHGQAELDDLFAQWESDPLQLLSFPDLGM